MSIVLGLVVLAVLIGFVCYSSNCTLDKDRKRITDPLNPFK